MTINARLDEIAEEVALRLERDTLAPIQRSVIRAALNKAIELVLTAEPSYLMRHDGREAIDAYQKERADPAYGCFRAMTAALREEIKNETPGS